MRKPLASNSRGFFITADKAQKNPRKNFLRGFLFCKT